MKRYLWTGTLILVTVIAASCGDNEPAPVEDTDEQTDVEVVTETTTIPVTALPEPWPVDFPIPDCFEVIFNGVNEDGYPVLTAIVPEGTDRPGIWDLGYYFRDNMDAWGVAEEDNMSCILTAFSFDIPLTQGDKYILVHGSFDTDNIMTIELFWYNGVPTN
ncbi:MAG: hypothetical protein KAR44_14525 [Candidatus Aegiribacteria sp.]|nr:hypothetical protein [Candidatus Aegiribacteria sp.]